MAADMPHFDKIAQGDGANRTMAKFELQLPRGSSRIDWSFVIPA
jgi:hypothetical protein